MIQNKKVLAVIPARLGSRRLKNKPLVEIDGQTLVERVWRRVSECKAISRLVVATDAEEIRAVAEGFGAEVIITDSDLPSGSARCLAVAESITEDFELLVNIQGDMPFICPEMLASSIDFFFENREEFSLTTVATPIYDEQEFKDPNNVKVVLGDRGRALYFSRAEIPFSRDGERLVKNGKSIFGYKHLGLYLYKPEVLKLFANIQKTSLERIECLEQLRVLEAGKQIGVQIIELQASIEIDTAEDLAKARGKS